MAGVARGERVEGEGQAEGWFDWFGLILILRWTPRSIFNNRCTFDNDMPRILNAWHFVGKATTRVVFPQHILTKRNVYALPTSAACTADSPLVCAQAEPLPPRCLSSYQSLVGSSRGVAYSEIPDPHKPSS